MYVRRKCLRSRDEEPPLIRHCILSLFVPSPCSATLGAHLSTRKGGTNGMAVGGGERAERRERSRGPTKIRWSARSRAETEENAKQTMPPPSLSVCASPDLLVAVLICCYFGIRGSSFRVDLLLFALLVDREGHSKQQISRTRSSPPIWQWRRPGEHFLSLFSAWLA